MRRRSFLRAWVVVVALAALAPTPLRAQEGESPLVPRGVLKLEAMPQYLSWSSRFGSAGSEPVATPLSDPTGALLFPEIATLEETLLEWLGDPSLEATLGGSRAYVSASRVRVPLRAEVGVLDRLTLGVMVPLVKNRSEVEFAFRADSATATLGVNPALRTPAEVLAFTNELRVRSRSAAELATQLCADAPASPECSAADALAKEASSLHTGFVASYGASPFYLLASSSAAQALRQRIDTLSAELAAAGLPALTRAPLFASGRLDRDALSELFSDDAFGINAAPLGDHVGVWEVGDIEVNAALRLLEGDSRDSAATRSRFAYQLGAAALVRIGSGASDDPNVFFDLAAGDGQTDIEGRVFSTLWSGRFALWSDLRYGVQRTRTIERRVGPADRVLVPAINTATLEWTPGSYLQLDVVPRYHLSDELSLTGAYRLYSKGEDAFERVSPAPEPEDTAPIPSPTLYTDVSILESGTEETLHEVGGGLLFSTLGSWQAGRAARPFELRFDVRWGVSGSGVYVPAGVRALVGLRLYFGLWGD